MTADIKLPPLPRLRVNPKQQAMAACSQLWKSTLGVERMKDVDFFTPGARESVLPTKEN